MFFTLTRLAGSILANGRETSVRIIRGNIFQHIGSDISMQLNRARLKSNDGLLF